MINIPQYDNKVYIEKIRSEIKKIFKEYPIIMGKMTSVIKDGDMLPNIEFNKMVFYKKDKTESIEPFRMFKSVEGLILMQMITKLLENKKILVSEDKKEYYIDTSKSV